MLYAVVTLLNEEDRNQLLKMIPGLKSEQLDQDILRYLHISWIVSENIEVPRVENCISHLASISYPINFFSGGLGVFTGENPAIVLNFARNSQANYLHTQIWTICNQNMGNVKAYSHPDRWMPHVTLLHDLINLENPLRFLNTHIQSSIRLQICVDNLAIIYRDNGNAGMISKFEFRKDKNEEDTEQVS